MSRSPAWPPSRKDRRRRQHLLGIGLVMAALLLAGAIGYAYWEARAAQVDRDAVTLCPVVGERSVTAVLIDATDSFTPVQRAAVRQAMADLQDKIPQHGALVLYLVRADAEDRLEPVVRRCNPGRGKEDDWWFGNPPKKERRWREGFDAPVREALNKLFESDAAAHSPIIESLQAIAVSAFGGRQHAEIPKRLVIVSDMLQNSDAVSHYRTPPDWDDLRASPFYWALRSDLRGVEVEIHYVRRPSGQQIQGRAHLEYWRAYFADQNATVVRILELAG